MPSDDDNMPAIKHDQDSDVGKTIIRVRVGHRVQISLNSLVSPAVTSFYQDVVMNVSQIFSNWRISF